MISEGELVEIEQRALRLERRSMNDDGEIEDWLGTSVAEDVAGLVALLRSFNLKKAG